MLDIEKQDWRYIYEWRFEGEPKYSSFSKGQLISIDEPLDGTLVSRLYEIQEAYQESTSFSHLRITRVKLKSPDHGVKQLA